MDSIKYKEIILYLKVIKVKTQSTNKYKYVYKIICVTKLDSYKSFFMFKDRFAKIDIEWRDRKSE